MIREEQRELALLEEITVKKKDLAFISELDQGQGVSEGQFILAVLEHLGTLNFDKDIKPWREKFRELDPKNTGKVFSQVRVNSGLLPIICCLSFSFSVVITGLDRFFDARVDCCGRPTQSYASTTSGKCDFQLVATQSRYAPK